MVAVVIILSIANALALVVAISATVAASRDIRETHRLFEQQRERNGKLAFASLGFLKLLELIGMSGIDYDAEGNLKLSCIPEAASPVPIPDVLRSELALSVQLALEGAQIKAIRQEPASDDWGTAPDVPTSLH